MVSNFIFFTQFPKYFTFDLNLHLYPYTPYIHAFYANPTIFEKYKKSLFSKLTGSDSNDKSCVPINKWKKGEKMQLLYF